MVSFSLMIGRTPNSSRARIVFRVQVALAMVQVFGRQQHLAHVVPVFLQAPLVSLHQEALACGRHRLKLGQVGGTPTEPKAADPSPYGSGTDQDDLPAGGHGLVEVFRQQINPFEVEHPVGLGEDASADLDDHGGGRCCDFLA